MTAHRHRRHPTELKIRLAESYLKAIRTAYLRAQ
jgi:hypothetical protein